MVPQAFQARKAESWYKNATTLTSRLWTPTENFFPLLDQPFVGKKFWFVVRQVRPRSRRPLISSETCQVGSPSLKHVKYLFPGQYCWFVWRVKHDEKLLLPAIYNTGSLSVKSFLKGWGRSHLPNNVLFKALPSDKVAAKCDSTWLLRTHSSVKNEWGKMVLDSIPETGPSNQRGSHSDLRWRNFPDSRRCNRYRWLAGFNFGPIFVHLMLT